MGKLLSNSTNNYQKVLNKWVLPFLIIILLANYQVYSQSNLDSIRKDSKIVEDERIAGFRASRILSSYPNRIFPEPEYWESVGDQMSSKFFGYQPGGVLIVSIYLSDPLGFTLLNFPNPTSTQYDSIIFSSTDQNERFLNHFDTTGVKVWLQVEPGGANIDTLINLVLNKYKHHPSVLGFGVDVEWYQTYDFSGGRKINDAEVERWENNVKSINENSTLFLKHYSDKWMPPNYRGDLIFIDDSQDFNWYSNPYDGMITEFKNWGNKFSPNNVGFQIGYPADENWWGIYSDPVKELGDRLIANVPNLTGLYWVDFTVISVFPPTSVKEIDFIPSKLTLEQNYPNPFNPSTTIKYSIPKQSNVTLKVYDVLGREVTSLVNKEQPKGNYEVEFDGNDLTSGIYFYRLKAGDFVETKKMILLK